MGTCPDVIKSQYMDAANCRWVPLATRAIVLPRTLPEANCKIYIFFNSQPDMARVK
ncbi:MAG: hypothetical protein V7608_888 [Hyphomicrobiales bacterium]|jgi:hypothetical protein